MWPIKEAERILKQHNGVDKIILSTGFGPSGMPHIGTFCEVFRTNCVAKALRNIDSSLQIEIIVVSDDMDGLRKIPSNIVNSDLLKNSIDMPISSIPDPTGQHESYGKYINSCLIGFLDKFDFEYRFVSASECYKSGLYNEKLLLALQKYDEIMKVMLPTLGEERQRTYSPFMPICPRTGKVLQVKLESVNIKSGTITYIDPETRENVEISVINGNCKLQWKPDWGMRWAALGVDYEMHGKDLSPSAVISSKICRLLNGSVPILYKYEMFLDQDGKKISKSSGNGLSIESWLKYAPVESMGLYMLNNPNRAKRIHFDIIPKSVDDYIALLRCSKDFYNPEFSLFYLHLKEPKHTSPVSFTLLLNLASACNPENKNVLLGFIDKNIDKEISYSRDFLNKLVDFVMVYYTDIIKPNKVYKKPSDLDKKALSELASRLSNLSDFSEKSVQNLIFDVGKVYYKKEEISLWFKSLYQVLLGQDSGPKFGSFVVLYGVEETVNLITDILNTNM